MGTRRQARERAMQALFFMDIQKNMSLEMFERYCECFSLSEALVPFLRMLVSGVLARKTEIDTVIERFSDNWKLSRMACVDRNIMRVAVFELLHCADIPPKVTINEAIDVGKKYGTEESGAFINGILDSIHQALQKGDQRIGVEKQKEQQ